MTNPLLRLVEAEIEQANQQVGEAKAAGSRLAQQIEGFRVIGVPGAAG